MNRTDVEIKLNLLSPVAKKVLWAIKTKTSIEGITEMTLRQLFLSGFLREDYDIIGKRQVVLLTTLGKRALEILEDPDPPQDPEDPGPRPGKALKRQKSLFRAA